MVGKKLVADIGEIADERDVDGLVTALSRLVDEPGLGGTLAKAARAHIEAEYDVVRQGERATEGYLALLGRSP